MYISSARHPVHRGFVIPLLLAFLLPLGLGDAAHATGLEVEWSTEPDPVILVNASATGTVTANFVPSDPGVGEEETYTHTVSYTYSWSPGDGGACTPADGASASIIYTAKGDKVVTVTITATGSYTITDNEGNTRSVSIDEAETLTADIQVIELTIEVKRANLGTWGSSADIAVGGKSSDIHKADIRIKLDPVPSSALDVEVSLVGVAADGAGPSPVKTELTIDALSLSGVGSDTLSLVAAETTGQLISSNRMGVQTVSAGDQSATATNVWDNYTGDDAWISDPEFFTQPGESTETVTFKLDNVALDGHEMRFYVEEVVYIDADGEEQTVSNTASSPMDVSEYATFRSMTEITDANESVTVDLLVHDPEDKYIVSLLLVAYDADARNDTPSSSMRTMIGSRGLFQAQQAQVPEERQHLENKNANGDVIQVMLDVDSDNNAGIGRIPARTKEEREQALSQYGMFLPISHTVDQNNNVVTDLTNRARMMVEMQPALPKNTPGLFQLFTAEGDQSKIGIYYADNLLIGPGTGRYRNLDISFSGQSHNFEIVPFTPGAAVISLVYLDGDGAVKSRHDVKITVVAPELGESANTPIPLPVVTRPDSQLNRFVYLRDKPSNLKSIWANLAQTGANNMATWSIRMEYRRPNRSDDQTFTCGDTPTSGFSSQQAWGEYDVYGGLATLKYIYHVGKTPLPEAKSVFHIRGTNPTPAMVSEFIQSIAGVQWYLLPIARVESITPAGATEFKHFNSGQNVGPRYTDYVRCPNLTGKPEENGYGWGIMQLDNPRPSSTALWNWETNIERGYAHLEGPCRTEANAWLDDQIGKQGNDVPANVIDNVRFDFTGTIFRQNTTRTPLHALTIQRYNGAGRWAIRWIEREFDANNQVKPGTGVWGYARHRTVVDDEGNVHTTTYLEYINAVCERINK